MRVEVKCQTYDTFRQRPIVSMEEYEVACTERFAADNIQYERVITYLHTGKHIAGLTNAERLKIWRQSTIFQWDSTRRDFCDLQLSLDTRDLSLFTGSIDCEPDSLSLPDETAAASEDLADLPSDEEISSYEQDQNSEREDLPNQSSKNVAAAQEKQEVQFKNSDLLNDPPDVQLSTNPTPPSSPTCPIMSMEEYEVACTERFAADNIQYERVITYLHTGKHIAGLTNAERLKIWRQSTIFQWDSTQEVLYYTRRKDGIRRQVVRSPDERNRVLHLYHGNPTGGGHSGWNATYEKVSKNYFWRKMQDDVKHYVATCNKCQRYTPLKTQAHTMTPIKVKEPWSRHDRWGPPGRILTDQGPEFCSLDLLDCEPDRLSLPDETAAASEDLADLPSDEEISSYEQDQNSEREDLPNQSSKNVEAAQEKQKVQYRNRKIKAVKMYNINVGMLVLRRNLRNESRKGGKMEPKWSGPYKVLDIDSY
ncbi:uncharacterized protein LOC121860073, partial [Homarus americanus]|uniref:uncharacterized protein LOC121860073 n=1 Tax=Homarus americanus TaxID=6706 RepID=UPI001C43C58E